MVTAYRGMGCSRAMVAGAAVFRPGARKNERQTMITVGQRGKGRADRALYHRRTGSANRAGGRRQGDRGRSRRAGGQRKGRPHVPAII